MKRLLCLLFAISLLLTGCAQSSTDTQSNQSSKPDTPNTEDDNHSVYYADRVNVNTMAFYFNDVCFGNEYGDAKQIITKWQDPIMFYVDGVATIPDYEVLNSFIDFLNNIDGFPGIMQIHDRSQANLVLNFCGLAEFNQHSLEQNANGFATFNYTTATGVITDGQIYIRTDIDQTTRSSVILEEVYQILGPTKDTLLRNDSIIYQHGDVSELSKEDKSIISLLYNSRITAGMTPMQSEEIIREIYY